MKVAVAGLFVTAAAWVWCGSLLMFSGAKVQQVHLERFLNKGSFAQRLELGDESHIQQNSRSIF